MGVTTQHHQHHDYTDAARRTLADEVERIARAYEFHANRHLKNAAHMLEQAQAERDTGHHKNAVAEQARRFVNQLRHDPGDVTPDDREAMLTWLAQQANHRQIDDEHLPRLIAGWAPGVDADQRGPLFDDLCEAIRDRDGLETGEIDWRTVPVASGIGGRERALELAHGRVDAALWPLTHPGEKRCVDCVGRSARPRVATVGDLCDYHHERRQLDANRNGTAA